ncbi:MAG: cupin domain-containing protein [Gemmatimonadetes bacterium]|nr:cupin domain-containing protein [Gemmatimonadota bacterium]
MQTTHGTARAAIVHPDQGWRLSAFGVEIAFMLTGETTGGALALGCSTVPPGGGPPPHSHEEDELFIVIEGHYGFLVEGEWRDARAGSVVYLPRGTVHAFRNMGDVDARHWVLTTPAGFEDFYAGAARLFEAPGGPEPAQVVALAAEHGIRFC